MKDIYLRRNLFLLFGSRPRRRVSLFTTDIGTRALLLLPNGRPTLLRALAIALVFALFRLNPAPFCLLDEVDAPLDDSNTERFCDLVKEMSSNTQFLYVSHNKITMELAEQLIGVTMQESGVSKIVEVDLNNAKNTNQNEATQVSS